MENTDRIDKLIAAKYAISRNDASILLEQGNVAFKGKKVTKTHLKINEDDIKEIHIEQSDLDNLDNVKTELSLQKELEKTNKNLEEKEKEIEELKTKILNEFKIVYEDDNILGVYKPKDLVVYSGVGKENISVVSILKDKYNMSLSNLNGEDKAGIVHRIDKDTSGILVVAKNNITHKYLEKLFKDREVYKEYLVLVKGNIQESKGKIDMPIARSTTDFKKREVSKLGKEAITYFEVIERFKKHTLVKANIVTGRTHQIRVHFEKIGYPVVGDVKYSKESNDFNMTSQLLHAHILRFKNIDGKEIELKAELPKEFKEVLKKLESQLGR